MSFDTTIEQAFKYTVGTNRVTKRRIMKWLRFYSDAGHSDATHWLNEIKKYD